jgi:hypothetical protein
VAGQRHHQQAAVASDVVGSVEGGDGGAVEVDELGLDGVRPAVRQVAAHAADESAGAPPLDPRDQNTCCGECFDAADMVGMEV